jgi:hypothetical protein
MRQNLACAWTGGAARALVEYIHRCTQLADLGRGGVVVGVSHLHLPHGEHRPTSVLSFLDVKGAVTCAEEHLLAAGAKRG